MSDKSERGVAQPAVPIVPVPDSPIRSGSDVVAAATIPPVGTYVSALSVTSERYDRVTPWPLVGALSGPVLPPLLGVTHLRKRVDPSGERCDGCHTRRNGYCSPARTVNSAKVVKFGRGSQRATRGTVHRDRQSRAGRRRDCAPTGQSTRSRSESPAPSAWHVARDTFHDADEIGLACRTGMQSTTRTVPWSVVNSVSSTSECPRYRRRIRRTPQTAQGASGRERDRPAAPRNRPANQSAAGRASRSTHPAHQRRGVRIADERVIFDRKRHDG